MIANVYDQVYVGSYQNSTTRVLHRGIKSVVTCSFRGEPLLENLLEYYHYPFFDDDKPDEGIVRLAVNSAFIATRPLLVTCKAGINRSCAVVAGLLMLERNLTVDEAVAVVRAARPQALKNGAMIDLLRRLSIHGR